MKKLVVTGSFDNLGPRQVRFLEEASKAGSVHVLLWSDETVRALEGRAPAFPEEERLYLLQAIRYVSQVTLLAGQTEIHALPRLDGVQPDLWVVDEASDDVRKRAHARSQGMEYRVVEEESLRGFPPARFEMCEGPSSRKRVMVTGCFDWFHSGHVRFFEVVSQLGDLYVVVGHDENIRLLKGPGHPMFPQDERRYMVQSVRHVRQALISTGQGWMDAEPEIALIRPDMYAVNEDGDKPEKRPFCEAHGIQYVVLKRIPKEGLPRRQSTNFRGF
jgi:cytidyltransferase-like protein